MSDTDFMVALRNLINVHSKENGSDTPDFVLAEYLHGCLKVFDYAVCQREFLNEHSSKASVDEKGEEEDEK